MWKKIHLDSNGQNISAATALILFAIDELSQRDEKGTYGYEIMDHLHKNYNWAVKSGTVYPILKKLNSDGFIRIEYRPIPSNRNQTYYLMTPNGKKLVEQLKSLNDSALEEAFELETSAESVEKVSENKGIILKDLSLENFCQSILNPFLSELNNKILACLSNNSNPPDLNKAGEEIQQAIDDLDDYKVLLKNHINTINSMKKFKHQ
jgi:DNA-binding PadR family transcriptional regulator